MDDDFLHGSRGALACDEVTDRVPRHACGE
jgi:hypothetical protein